MQYTVPVINFYESVSFNIAYVLCNKLSLWKQDGRFLKSNIRVHNNEFTRFQGWVMVHKSGAYTNDYVQGLDHRLVIDEPDRRP